MPIPIDPQTQSHNGTQTAKLRVSPRLGSMLDVIARELQQVEPLLDAQPNLDTVTLILKLGRDRKLRTVLIRTESKSELARK